MIENVANFLLGRALIYFSTGYKLVRQFSIPATKNLASAETVCDGWLPSRNYHLLKKWLPAETVLVILLPSKTVARKLAESYGQSWQEAIYHAQKSGQEARDGGQSWGKRNMTSSLGRKQKTGRLVYTLCLG